LSPLKNKVRSFLKTCPVAYSAIRTEHLFSSNLGASIYYFVECNEGCLSITANVKALAMWPEFMASSAWLPMPDKDILFQLKSAAQ
jgi:hypothetical protein